MSDDKTTMPKQSRRIRLQTKLGIGFTVLAIFISALLTLALYNRFDSALTEHLRDQLHDSIGIASMYVDGDTHVKIKSQESPEYKQFEKTLQLIRDTTIEADYVETLRRTPEGKIIFVVDAEVGEDKIPYGDEYEEPGLLTKATYETIESPVVEKDFVTDEWGTFLTGYAPFYTSDGEHAGFLAMDISKEQIQMQERKFLWIALAIFGAMIPLSLVLGMWAGRKMAASIVRLKQGADRIANGDLDSKVVVRSHDEVEDLAHAFNKMTEDLKTYIKNLKETTAAKERIEADLRIAHDIQAGALPSVFPPFPNRVEFDIFASMEPAKEVGGDMYDFFFINDKKLFFLVGDVSGKGVPAALFMMITKTLLKSEAMRDIDPIEILSQANDIIYPDNDTCMFVTIFCAILDTETGELRYGNAGHNPPLVYRNGEDYEYLDVKKSFVFGPMPNTTFTAGELTLEPNDVIFVYSDGVTEALNPQEELYSEPRLQEALSQLRDKDVEETIKGVRKDIADFAQNAPQSDDITMLALKYKGFTVVEN